MKRVKPRGAEDVAALKRARECEMTAVALFDEEILTNPLITAEIFEDFPLTELLTCSLVSKAWNLTCRGILVDRFRTYFTLSDDLTVESLEDFYNLIRNVIPGHEHPVNGIRIKTYNCKWPFLPEPFADLISRIMGQMKVKFVSFDMSRLFLGATDLHDMFKTLVIPHLGTIRFLEIQKNMYGIRNLKTLSQQLEVDSLPNLKEFNLMPYPDRLKVSTLKRILRACPNLKKFPPIFPYQLPTCSHTNKLYLASKMRFNYMRLTPKDLQLLQDYGSLIKHLAIEQNPKQTRNQYEGDFISRLRPLFSSHLQQNLECLDVSVEPLVAILLQNTFPPLRNLKELFCEGGEIWFSCLFKNKATRFAEFLPNLKSVTLRFTGRNSRWLRRKYGTGNFRNPTSLFECKIAGSFYSVTALKLDGSGAGITLKQAQMMILGLEEVFPFVTYLDIQMDILGFGGFLKWICESWGDLLQVLILRQVKCFVSNQKSRHERLYAVSWGDFLKSKRKPLPAGVKYSDTLSHLRRLELEFRHENQDYNYADEEEGIKVQSTFESRGGQRVLLTLCGCRAEKRMKIVKSGVSVYDTVLALQPCPRNLEISEQLQNAADP